MVEGVIEKDPEKVTEESILVIPHAGVEYFEAAKIAKATIAAIGGSAEHLVLNSKENNIKLCLVQNAMESFEQGKAYRLSFDLEGFSRRYKGDINV
jgi:hypothetical protein